MAALRQSVADRRALLSLEREALTLLLQGDYRRSVDISAALVSANKASKRLLFYAACSSAGLTLLTSDNREAQLKAARDLFLKAAPAEAQFAKEQRYISPQILGLLRNAGASPGKR